MSITIKYDFISDNDIVAVAQVCDDAGIRPLSITFHPTMYDNVAVEFVDQKDAIRFTETYLDSTDPAEIALYV